VTTYTDYDVTGKTTYAVTDAETAMHRIFYGAISGFNGIMLDEATKFTKTRIYRFTNHTNGVLLVYNGTPALIGSIPIGKCAQVSLRDRSTKAGDWKIIIQSSITDFGNNGVLASNGSGVVAAVPLTTDTVLGMGTREIGALSMATLCDMLASGAWQIFEDAQAAAADSSVRVFRALSSGRIGNVTAEVGVAATGTETMSVDVMIGNTSCLTTPIVLDVNTVLDTPVEGSIDTDNDDYVAGDLIKIVRDHTPGNTPTMANTIAAISTTP
jgi:hypothetical protein